MSLHSDNVTTALANHKAYFGEGSTSAQRVEYRESDKCNWSSIDNAVVHGEFISNVRSGANWSKQTKRNIFCDVTQVTNRVNAHVRVGGDCGQIYNVSEITRKGNRYMLGCTRVATVETTRPDYRTPSRR